MKMMNVKFFRLQLLAILSIVVLLLNSCERKDIVSASDFYIDLNTGNVTDKFGAYQTNIPDYTNLYLTGGYVYVYGIIVFKALDQSYYALSQYHSTDGCSVEYEAGYDDLVCPCDEFHFDKYGQETIGNGTSYLAAYGTSLNNQLLHIYTP